jgi:hypothetical protein
VFTQDYARPRASKLVERCRDDGSRRSRAARQMMLLVGAGVVAAVGAQSAAAADWSIQPVLLPLRPASTELSGVSCLSTSDCIAVGVANVNATGPLVEHWNGTSWSIERTPIPPLNDGGGALSGVSCTSSSACTAVGSFGSGDGPLAERRDGRGWSVQDDYGSDNHSDYYVEVFDRGGLGAGHSARIPISRAPAARTKAAETAWPQSRAARRPARPTRR